MDWRCGLVALVWIGGAGCSAVVSPDTTRLRGDAGGVSDGSTTDDAGPGDDTGSDDAWVAPGDDAWVAPGDDAWVAPGDDAWVATSDAWVAPDTGPVCVRGVECAGYQDALGMAPREAAGNTAAEALAYCAIQLHRADCCGARDAYGINHAARSTLCPAEVACDAMYPRATCVDNSITTDTRQRTSNPNAVRLRAVNPMPCAFGTCWRCETFVCTSPACASAPGISGGCGP